MQVTRLAGFIGATSLLAAVVVGLAVLTHADPEVTGAGEPTRPNFVVIQTDDQTAASFNRRTMPRTSRLLADRGTIFSEYVVSSPLCCPSRAALETGQYPHNNGVVSNSPGYSELLGKHNTLPTWLRRAGYRTAHLGKYMNGYDRFSGDGARRAPGWDEWVTLLQPYSYYGYELGVNGERVRYGDSRGDYLTTVLNRSATRIVRKFAEAGDPFYVQLDHLAPHGQSVEKRGSCGRTALPLPGDFRRFAREKLPAPPSFDEDDVSDKPPFRRLLGRLPAGRVESIRDNYRCRIATLRAVDRGVARIHRALGRAGALDDTVIVFTSDNGFLQGEHRIPSQKAQAFEEAIRVPMVVLAPDSVRAGTLREPVLDVPVSNIDLAPTFLEMAGARPCREPGRCRTLDGRSLVPLLTGRPDRWPRERGILTRFESGHRRNTPSESCAFSAIRTLSFTYAEHSAVPDRKSEVCRPATERELYDLRSDPYQLQNLEADERAEVREVRLGLEIRLAALAACAGIEGRDAPVGDRPFCE
jgi:N-acetylglucosamine-6-sulfatase